MNNGELKRRFGTRVQRLREAAGLTQEELAARIGRSVDTVGNIERGVNATRIEIAYLLAINLGVTMPKLFDLGENAATDTLHNPQLAALLALVNGADERLLLQITELVRVGLKLADHDRVEADADPWRF